MIIKRFQEQVEASPGKIAIKTKEQTLTYCDLNKLANRAAAAIIKEDLKQENSSDTRVAALLFEHGPDMIVGVIGALIANRIYAPLDTGYPEKRLIFMLTDSGAGIILTNNKNFSLAQQLVRQSGREIVILNIDDLGDECPVDTIKREAAAGRIAYILYTSGSTAQPKGVFQTHDNVLYYTRNWIERFAITAADRMSLFTAFSHDGAVQDIFSALLSGACLYPYSIKYTANTGEMCTLLQEEKITIWHSVPSLFRYFVGTLAESRHFPHLRWILLGGEPLRAHDLTLFKTHFPAAQPANVYGQTESSVASICSISLQETATFDDIFIGEPLDETEILLVDKENQLVEEMGVGEVVIACNHIAPGYWRQPEATAKVFKEDEELGRLYFTGDMARLSANGSIKVIGRMDSQVKVRGFRVEPGEIETVLLKHDAVKEAAATARAGENDDNYLCAYYVATKKLSPAELREHIAAELPDYMMPRYFIQLQAMPLTPNGKIDRKALPEQEEEIAVKPGYAPPTNETEEKLVAIWLDVFEIEKVGIDDNFIELGGHSMLVISIISRIHQVFDVELQMADVFTHGTIRNLARLIGASRVTQFTALEPAEEKEYYPAVSDQLRLFALNHLEGIGVTYNITGAILLADSFEWERVEGIFQQLIRRHEVLRTSFRMMEDGLVQVIHRDLDFHITYVESSHRNPGSETDMEAILHDFIRPFDLGKAPLFRVQLVKMAAGRRLFLLDMHHIIVDGVSENILMSEFSRLYDGEELPPLKFRYRDYSEWLNRLPGSQQLKFMEGYWLNVFKDKIPVLNLPYNYPRPAIQSFAGGILRFELDKELTTRLNRLVKETGTTLYIIILAVYIILLHKYSGQEDIVVGSIIAGRSHVDLENIIGFFAKTLPLRNYPAADKTFTTFLREVKESVLNASQNQSYPFMQLVEKLHIKKDPGRNPLFDVAFLSQKTEITAPGESPEEMKVMGVPYKRSQNRNVMFDLHFETLEREEDIVCSLQYCLKLFKSETIELMKERFLVLIENILNNRGAKIRDLDYASPMEKEITAVQEIEFEL